MTEHLYITAVTGPDVNNGEGIRLTIWVQGCNHNCPGCHNPQTHHYVDETENLLNKQYIKVINDDNEISDELKQIIKTELIRHDNKDVHNFLYTGVTFSGGDPLAQSPTAIKELQKLIEYIITLRNDINIWLYTGYKYEQLKNIDYLYKFLLTTGIDVLIDGMFIKELKPLHPETLPWRGSSNQRLIDLRATICTDNIILYQ